MRGDFAMAIAVTAVCAGGCSDPSPKPAGSGTGDAGLDAPLDAAVKPVVKNPAKPKRYCLPPSVEGDAASACWPGKRMCDNVLFSAVKDGRATEDARCETVESVYCFRYYIAGKKATRHTCWKTELICEQRRKSGVMGPGRTDPCEQPPVPRHLQPVDPELVALYRRMADALCACTDVPCIMISGVELDAWRIQNPDANPSRATHAELRKHNARAAACAERIAGQ